MKSTFQGHFEYIIVGSGAGGATIFNELTLLHKEVLMIEEGSDNNHDFSVSGDRIATSFLEKYRNGGLSPVIGNPSFTFSEGVGLGGSTEVNGALFWRTPKNVVNDWVEIYNLKTMQNLEEHFEFYEKTLEMSNLNENFPSDYNSVSRKIKEACVKLDWKVEPARRIAPRCKGSNHCATGCPNLSKNTMSRTLIPKARNQGGAVLTNFKVLKFEYSDRVVTGVIGIDGSTGRLETIKCKNLILSAGAFSSPEILHRSSTLSLSKNKIGFHLNFKIICEYPEKVYSSKGTIFTEQVQEFLNDGFIFMTSNFQPEYLALNLGSLDRKEAERVFNEIDHMAIITVQIRPFGYGMQVHHGNSSSKFFRIQGSDKDLLRVSLSKAIEAIFLSGAKRVLLPFDTKFIESYEMAKTAIASSPIQDWQLSSVHAMSTLPMREKKSLKNVGEDGTMSEFRNLWICDASILPTTIGESPQETIMAVVRNLTKSMF